MNRFGDCLAGKIYTIKKQYPVITELGCRIREVERELNRAHIKQNPMCGNRRKCMCNDVCKNRQKR